MTCSPRNANATSGSASSRRPGAPGSRQVVDGTHACNYTRVVMAATRKLDRAGSVAVRLTAAQRRRVFALADAAGVTAAEVVRRAIARGLVGYDEEKVTAGARS